MKKRIFIITFVLVGLCVIAFAAFMINQRIQTLNLFDAIKNDDYNAAKKAIDNGADVNDRKNHFDPEYNPTPLVAACYKENEEIIKLLVENGADVNKTDAATDISPLIAVLGRYGSKRFSLAFYLIENGADIYYSTNTHSSFARTIHVLENDSDATIQEGFELFKYYIDNNVDISKMGNSFNALTYAAKYANYNVVRYLVENAIFDVDEFDEIGQTALIAATQVEEIKMVELLLELGANKNLNDTTGKTAYDYAVELGNEELMILLK